MENLHDKRKVYSKDALIEANVKPDAMDQFASWYADAARDSSVAEANAMSVSTVEEDGCPRTRTVLLKSFGADGFVFYTNYHSRKGRALAHSPKACLMFFWPNLERQVIIKAEMERVPDSQSDAYFAERPRGSQLGALVSPQSEEIPSRAYLEEHLRIFEEKFEHREIPRPENWGGYLARPYEIEFWQGRPNRLHDRLLYTKNTDAGNWKITRLAP